MQPVVLADSIPPELKRLPCWVPWNVEPRAAGKPAKVPIQARTGGRADVTNPRHLVGFEAAHDFHLSRRTAGVGFVFRAGDPFAGVDFDHCRDPRTGEIDPLTRQVLDELATYAEVSPSETGVKAIVKGKLDPSGRNRAWGIELYDRGRFFALTGHRLPFAPPTIEPREGMVRRLQAMLARPVQPRGPEPHGGGFPGDDGALLATAFGAKNGRQVRALWHGRHDHPSPSEALIGLANHLAFYTGDDPDRLERLILASPLFAETEAERPKWESWRRCGTWGRRYVIERAIRDCRRFYGRTRVGDGVRTVRGGVRVPAGSRSDTDTQDERPRTCGSHGTHSGGLTAAWQRVLSGDVPAGLERVTGRGRRPLERRRKLATLCWNLGRWTPGRRFFLADVDAARLLGVAQQTAGRLLKALQSRPICLIRRVTTGNSYSGLASEYQWIGPSYPASEPAAC